MKTSRNTLRLLIALTMMGAMAPVVIWGSRHSVATMFNAPPMWIPSSLPYRRQYDWFRKQFASEDTVLLSWPGCTIDDTRLQQFADALMSPADGEKGVRNRELFERVITGPQLLTELTSVPLRLSKREALARMKGSFVGTKNQTSCAVIVMSVKGTYQRSEALHTILETAQLACGLPQDQFFLAGPLVDGAAIDAVSIRAIDSFSIPMALVALVLCWWCLRSWSFTLLILAVAWIGEGLVLTLVNFSGKPMNAVLIIMPALVFVLTISAGVHMANYYRDALGLYGLQQATERAMRNGRIPCLLAAMTTVIGLGSLMVSDIIPVQTFSIIASLGVVTTVALLFLTMPGVMDLDARRRAAAASEAARSEGHVDGFLTMLARFIVRFPRPIVACFAMLMVLMAWGSASIQTSVSVHAMFVPQSRVMRDCQWLEENLGPLVPLEVIVRFDSDCELPPLERMELVRDVQSTIAELSLVDGTMSAATFFPRIPSAGGLRHTAQRAALRRRLADSLGQMTRANYVAEADGRQSWRISGRVTALKDIDYGDFLHRLRTIVEPKLQEQGGDKVHAVYTGSLPVVYEAQKALLRDLFRSYLTAFALVAIVMMIVLRSVWAGALAMLPNLFPTLVLFGSMGWLKVPVDIGSVMTASVALGIAVDDTLHFLIWYQRESNRGLTPVDAVHSCFRHCGRAMAQTSFICGLGLLVYGLSEFVPTQRFAWFMLWLLMAALAGDLILLPALLLSPLGKAFRRRSPTATPRQEDVPSLAQEGIVLETTPNVSSMTDM